ncbi:ribosome maturation factor RimP [Salipaludibacillus agaradhaerens]|uniref:ribosome maturation factor RimP n=1 Tax=Salipaludibacillus agaradhaerens TaxID=76935 RepID=UPI002150FD53|nr:ribosome maturation factor RimP [Salipaludibacillus agaradhaerens]MCR6107030.1 ribosome maturation factor RimP [Salipaludibacillus agaradhaerens]MCR6119061.1 ribosome maturation factor RimP [Salipaludibacillus agaradhaerens]UJW58113.1 ribosome maturation factor RimP [Bacillus sp. A116_S68]
MAESIHSTIEQLVQPVLEELSLELVDVEFQKEGKSWFLRVYIDGDGGVDLDDCTSVSERLSELLDEHDPIEQAYYLEVSSPGAERPLKKEKDMENAIGKNVFVTTYAPINGEKAFEGKLTQFDGETLTIETKIKTRIVPVNIPYNKVAKARLAVVF